MDIVVVESPSKAKTINKYLGSGYEVLASFGHIRDLPPKDGSVDPDNDFRMLWEVDARSNQRMNDIARALKGADKLILATDPDREGEAISWHVLEVLKEYNNSDAYAIAVGHLADRIHGGGLIKTVWPKDDHQLSRDARIALQKKLSELGYKVNDFEGHIDFDLRDNIRVEQKKLGLLPDGTPTAVLLEKLGVKAQ